MAGDTVTTAYSWAQFTDANAKPNITVKVYDISIAGADAGNYHLTNTEASAIASIDQLAVTVTAEAKEKTYGAADPDLTFQKERP